MNTFYCGCYCLVLTDSGSQPQLCLLLLLCTWLPMDAVLSAPQQFAAELGHKGWVYL